MENNLKKYGLVARVAAKLGVPPTTLASAVRAGKVSTATLGCGQAVVEIASARAWFASPRKRGPRRRST